jgi:hypothetical protein
MTTRRARYGLLSALVLTCSVSASAPMLAQAPSSTLAKWRPRDGVYAPPGKDFAKSCIEYRDPNVQLREKQILGYDWACVVSNLADVAPGTIRLDMTCLDDDVAQSQDTESKEVMLLKKIDDKSMWMRRTSDGKFTNSEFKVVYCPKKAQQMFLNEMAKKEKEQNTVWLPRDGVYARYEKSYTDFNNQCMKSGDAVLALAKSSVSVGAERCHASRILLKPPTTIEMDVDCNQSDNQTVNDVGNTTTSEPAAETVTLTKSGKNGLGLTKRRTGENRSFSESFTYCPEAAQRAYADSKK